MTKEEIDTMWQQAMQESIKDGEMFTRYHFAKLVTERALADPMREVQRLGQEIEQEPVAWAMPQGWWIVESTPHNLKMWPTNEGELFVAGVTQPPQRTWVGLCEQQRNDIEDACEMIIGKPAFDAIEAKLKQQNGYAVEKNT
jgi:hypothetical protein